MRPTGMARVASAAFTALASAALAAGPVHAASDATFIARYEHNAQIGAELLQKAEAAGGAGADVASLKQAVTALNQLIPALYTAEQALAHARSTASGTGLSQALLNPTGQRKGGLGSAIRAARTAIRGRSHGESQWVRDQLDDIHAAKAQLQKVASQLRQPAGSGRDRHGHPGGGHLAALQTAILQLQDAAIYDTGVWLTTVEPSAAAIPVSITGLSYAQAAVTVPTAGSAPAMDAVAAQPVVKSENGADLPATGSYSLAGPENAEGVTIDSITGTVTVNAGATPGQYTASYAQGGIADSFAITVS